MTKIVLCIPGLWDTRDKLVGALMQAHGPRFMFSGDSLLDTVGGHSVSVHEGGVVPKLDEAFDAVGVYSELNEADFAAIRTHKQCLFLVDENGGTLEAAATMLRWGQLLIQAGGFGMLVESSGKAHSDQEWLELDPSDPEDLFWAYVILVGTPNKWASRGMHHLGLPDIELTGVTDSQTAAMLVDTLGRYLLLDSPDIQSGESFGLGPDEPAYRMTMGPCTAFPEGDLYHNPHGVWSMEPAE